VFWFVQRLSLPEITVFLKKFYMKNILFLIFIFTIVAGCEKVSYHVTSKSDYQQYLTSQPEVQLVKHYEEAAFWSSKMHTSKNGYLFYQKYAVVQAELFEKTGDITHLYNSDSALLKAGNMVVGKRKAPVLLSLSSNSIKKHQFKAALDYAREAYNLTDQKYGAVLMMFDAYMELGLYDLAGNILKRNEKLDDFDYLVRLAKYEDHLGNLKGAIQLMEKALILVKERNDAAELWAISNLADMHGHNGNINEAYLGYLQVLDKDPNYLYALRGIAWVALSEDGKLKEAKEIIEFINSQKKSPDMYLMLAEIAEMQNDSKSEASYLEAFMTEATKPEYLGMYNKYLITLYAEKFGDYSTAQQLAFEEINNRATPMAYDLLAWTYYNEGKYEAALEIIKEHVEGKTFEPEIIYHMGCIYATNNQPSKAIDYLNEALEASFELGPGITAQVRNNLDTF
jgi:predicted Zn-dependent protease